MIRKKRPSLFNIAFLLQHDSLNMATEFSYIMFSLYVLLLHSHDTMQYKSFILSYAAPNIKLSFFDTYYPMTECFYFWQLTTCLGYVHMEIIKCQILNFLQICICKFVLCTWVIIFSYKYMYFGLWLSSEGIFIIIKILLTSARQKDTL